MVNNYQALLDMLRPKEEEPMMSQMTPEQQPSLEAEPMPMPENEMPEEPVVQPAIRNAMPQRREFPNLPNIPDIDKLMAGLPKDSDMKEQEPAQIPPTPRSRMETLLEEYNKLSREGMDEVKSARERDRMLRVGGAIGDALATYLNARSQMNVKAPGVQVQQGAGLGRIADMFATAPEVASDLKDRREALMEQYKLLSESKPGSKIYQTRSGLVRLGEDGKPEQIYSDPSIKRALDISESKLSQGESRLGLSKEAEERRKIGQKFAITEKAQEDADKAVKSLRATKTWQDAEKTISEARTLNTLLDDAYKKGGQSLAMLGPKVSKSIAGEVGVLTEADVTRYVQNPELIGGLVDTLKKVSSGKISEASYENLKRLLDIAEKEAKRKINNAIDREATLFSRREKIPYEQARFLIDENYKMRNFKNAPSTFEKSQLSTKDQQALDWANKNPDDPRSEQIKKKLGM